MVIRIDQAVEFRDHVRPYRLRFLNRNERSKVAKACLAEIADNARISHKGRKMHWIQIGLTFGSMFLPFCDAFDFVTPSASINCSSGGLRA